MMNFGVYDFSCRAIEGGRMPEYKGSAFRGAFGHALKKVTCAVRKKNCEDCLLAQRCLYARVFELKSYTAKERQQRMVSPPHPYVIEPPLTDQTVFGKGDEFHFSLLLFGEFNDYLPYFIYAFQQMGKKGIGSKNNPVKLIIEDVSVGGKIIYRDLDGVLEKGTWFQDVSFPLETAPPAKNLTIELLTPLRLKFENHLCADLPFHLLTRAALRRVSALFSTFGEGEPAVDYRGLVEKAKAVRIAEADLHWLDIKRYSLRQDSTMLVGGLTGYVTYEGDLGPFLPWLRLAERFHLGKQTSFGLGKITLADKGSEPL
jgi:hypothetical protein